MREPGERRSGARRVYDVQQGVPAASAALPLPMGRARRVQLHVRRRHLGMDGRQRERHHAELGPGTRMMGHVSQCD